MILCTMVNQKAQGLSRGSARFLNWEETGARSVPRRTALAGGEQIGRGTTTVPAVCLRIAPELLVGGGGLSLAGARSNVSTVSALVCNPNVPFARSEERLGVCQLKEPSARHALNCTAHIGKRKAFPPSRHSLPVNSPTALPSSSRLWTPHPGLGMGKGLEHHRAGIKGVMLLPTVVRAFSSRCCEPVARND